MLPMGLPAVRSREAYVCRSSPSESLGPSQSQSSRVCLVTRLDLANGFWVLVPVVHRFAVQGAGVLDADRHIRTSRGSPALVAQMSVVARW